MGSKVVAPDLEMVVRALQESGRTRLTYTLHSPAGAAPFYHREIQGPVIQGSPEEYHAHLLRKIENLGKRLDVDGSEVLLAEIDRKLEDLGRSLWRELFPSELQIAYREIRKSVRTWMIVSNEPWIPWELVKPYDDRFNEPIDDDFLALRFELTRWLAGDKTPAAEIPVRRIAAIRTSEDLPQPGAEMKVIKQAAEHLGADVKPFSPTSSEELLALLETCQAQVLHFHGHGTFTAVRPDESAIPLPDRSSFRPTDLEGPRATRAGQDRPLVFLNSCWAGQQGWSLTRVGGWAARWVGVCGCGAFIAPMWPVRNQAALEFARVFYEALAQEATLGEAAFRARQHLYKTRSGDPSALAYTVYGHPNARIRAGDSLPAGDVAEAPARPAPRETPPAPIALQPAQRTSSGAVSRNLRLNRGISDRDRDDFRLDAFEFIASFFEGSLIELERQNPGIETRFRREGDYFTAAIYRSGKKEAACRVRLGGLFGNGIGYSDGDSNLNNSYSENLTVADENGTLGLRSFMQLSGSRALFTKKEAAEHFWSMLLSRLR